MKSVYAFILQTVVLAVLLGGWAFAQGGPPRHERFRERIDQLEKIKLLEVLDLDEETSIRFFSRRGEHKDAMHAIQEEMHAHVEVMKEALESGDLSSNSPEYTALIQQHVNIIKKLSTERDRFFQSISEILTPEQVVKVIVFEKKIQEEIKKFIFKDKRRDGPPRR